MEHQSCREYHSQRMPGVGCRILKISFQRRLELLREIHSLTKTLEYAAAGDTLVDKFESAVVQHEINKRVWNAFVVSISGLSIDGQPATPELVWAQGPDELVQEVLPEISEAFSLSGASAKN